MDGSSSKGFLYLILFLIVGAGALAGVVELFGGDGSAIIDAVFKMIGI